ncbi:MAG TPA: hypothetical protein VIS96_15130 [Terrimicrobiaceae bacterium]
MVENQLNYFKGPSRSSGVQAVAQLSMELSAQEYLTSEVSAPRGGCWTYGQAENEWSDTLSEDSLVFSGLTGASWDIGHLGSVVLQSSPPPSGGQPLFEYASADLRIASPEEPGVVVLIAAGTTLLLWRRRRRFAC